MADAWIATKCKRDVGSFHLFQDSGVPFMVDGQITYLRGTLTIGSADNPAANLIGGYKSLTSAFRKCRTCMAVVTDMLMKVCCHT